MSGNGLASKKLCSCGRPGGCGHPPVVKWLIRSQSHEPREVCDACATEAPVTTHMTPINRRPPRKSGNPAADPRVRYNTRA